MAGRYAMALVALSLGCSAPQSSTVTAAGGRPVRFDVQASETANLIYQLDCVSGAAFCAKDLFRELWDSFKLSSDEEAALARWAHIRSRHSGVVVRQATTWPLLSPGAAYDRGERQRIAGLRATDLNSYATAMTALVGEADARSLREIAGSLAPRFRAWWTVQGQTDAKAYTQRLIELLADPWLDERVANALVFYGADPPSQPFEVHVIAQPRSERRLTVAFQLEDVSVVEARAGADPASLIDVVMHELFHSLFARMPLARRAAFLAKLCDSPDADAAIGFSMMDEVLAATLGNGMIGRHYLSADVFERGRARGFVHYEAAGSVARELYTELPALFDAREPIDGDRVRAAYTRALRAALPRLAPLDHLHAHVAVVEPPFAPAATALAERAWAGYPNLRTFAPDDPQLSPTLAPLACTSVAAFVAAPTDALLRTIGLEAAAISELRAGTGPRTVRSPRGTGKAFTFVFVAPDAAAMSTLVEHFMSDR